jgi:hypothetical protein
LPTGSFWDWRLNAGSGLEDTINFGRYDWSNNAGGTVVMVPGLLNDGANTTTFHAIQAGTQAHFIVTLHDNNGTVVDQGSVTAPWDPTAGLGIQILQKPAGSGVSPIVAQQIADIHDWTSAALPTSSGSFLPVPLDQLVQLPDLRQLIHQVGAFDLIGRGSILTPQIGGVVAAYGVALQTTQVPTGFGRRDGFLVKYQQRIAQLVMVDQELTSGDAMFTEVLEYDLSAFDWLFRNARPFAIAYDVTPGCVVHGRWLVLP